MSKLENQFTQQQIGRSRSVVQPSAQPSGWDIQAAQSPQRTLGNQALARRSASIPIQTKMTVGPANDVYENEADSVASQVVENMQAANIQRHDEEDESESVGLKRVDLKRIDHTILQRTEEEEDESADLKRVDMKRVDSGAIQRHEEEEDESADLKREAGAGAEGGEISSGVEDQIRAQRGGGSAIPEGARSALEGGFGADFSNVRVHQGGGADSLNRSLNARAFTSGSDIFFRSGEYDPESKPGQQLLAHELTHVVQQGAATQSKGH